MFVKISYIERTGRYKIRVTLADRDSFILSDKEWKRYDRSVGDELSEEELTELYKESFLPKAKLRALNLLKVRDRSRSELIQRLKTDGYPEEVIKDAIAYIDRYHYLDDERFTKNYIDYRSSSKSLKELEYALSKKGIDLKDMAEKTDIELPNDRDTIQKIIEKKWRGKEPDKNEKDKMMRYLGRRGFRCSDIFSVYSNMGI